MAIWENKLSIPPKQYPIKKNYLHLSPNIMFSRILGFMNYSVEFSKPDHKPQ